MSVAIFRVLRANAGICKRFRDNLRLILVNNVADAWLVAWHIRDESYSKGLAELVNAQHKLPFAAHWGEGTTSSSDGQRFRAGGRGESAGNRNAKYGSEPGVLFYTHLSDQY